MSISRRKFIKIGSVSAALVAGNCFGFGGNVSGQTKNTGGDFRPESYTDILSSYHADTFGKLVGTPFSLFAEGFAETAVLVAVQEISFAGWKGARGKKVVPAENFMLSFQISNAAAEQATYTVIHSELGQFDLLLVPAQSEKGEFLLNAVINRL